MSAPSGLAAADELGIECVDAAVVVEQHANADTVDTGISTAIYFAAFTGLGLIVAAPGPIFLALAKQTDEPIDAVGTIFITRAIGYVVGGVTAGWLLDRFPKYGNAVLAISVAVCSVCTMVVPMTASLTIVCVLFTSHGVTRGFLGSCGTTLLIVLHGKAVQPFMQALHLCFGIGAFVSPLLLSAVMGDSKSSDYGKVFYLYASYFGLLAVALFLVPSPTVPSATVPTGEAEEQGDDDHWRFKASIAVFLGLYVGTEAAFGGFLYSYGVLHLGMTSKDAHLLTAVFWGLLAIGRLVAVPLSVTVRPSSMIMVNLVGCFVATLAMALSPESPTVLWIVTAVLGGSMASIFPNAYNLASTSTTVSGKVASSFQVGAACGEMALPALAGVLFTQIGPPSYPFVILVSTCIMAGAFGLCLYFSPAPRPSE